MTLTKDQIREVLRGVTPPGESSDLVSSGALLWVATCESYTSLKVHPAAGMPVGRMEQTAKMAQAVLAEKMAQAGTPLLSLIVEFVDGQGGVVHTSRLGVGMMGGGRGVTAGGTQGTSPGLADSATPSASAEGEGGAARRVGAGLTSGGRSPTAAGAAGGGGHRPIGGLSQSPNPQQAVGAMPGVKHVIAVGAGKGGVGKSSVAVNLAVGLARRGHAVGLLDGDIYGPSMPTMLGLGAMEQSVLAGKLQPFLVHGIKAITIGKLVDAEKPLIWRGPMAHGAFKQLTEQTSWGELDYLIIDLPPGTGDVSLTMAQTMQLTGAVVVCTPQKVAQDDAVRATRMFQQLGIDVLGVVENMSFFIGDDGKVYDLFGRGGAEVMAQRMGVPFLGAVPITMSLRKNSDDGDPTANFTGTGAAEKRLVEALERVLTNFEGQVALAGMRRGSVRPTLTIS